MRSPSLLCPLLALSLLAAVPALADVPELNPNTPKTPPAVNPGSQPPAANPQPHPAAGVNLSARLQYWQAKLQKDQQRAALAQSRKNQMAYNRAEQAIQTDQTRISRLQTQLMKQARNGSGGTNGIAGGQRQSQRKLLRAEIAREQLVLRQLRAKLQSDRTSNPTVLPQDRAQITQVRNQLKSDRAQLAQLQGPSSVPLSNPQPWTQKAP